MRSLKVAPQYIEKVKGALRLNGYARQIDLAEDLAISISTVSNFLNGKPIDALNFYEICQKLGQDPKHIADLEKEEPDYSNYIPRSPMEELCYETIKKPGSLLRIKGPKGMGKTSLIEQILKEAKQNGYQTVYLSLLLADNTVLKGLKEFFRWFCLIVTRQLGLTNKLNEYWEDELGSIANCTAYFEEYLLPQLQKPLVLCLDDVDLIFKYPYIAEEFLKLIRAWYEQAKTQPIWKELRLVLGYSTEEYISEDINHSPFNVGVLIELPDFTPEQVQELAKGQGINWDLSQVQNIMNKVGGNPFLLQKAIDELKHQKRTLKELLDNASTEAGIYSDYLRQLLEILEKYPELAREMKRIVCASEAVGLNSLSAFKLHSLGLVELEGNKVKPRNQLYKDYFSKSLNNKIEV